MKVNYTKGDNAGWGFAPEGYLLSEMTSTPGTVVQGLEQTFIITVDAGANDGVTQTGTAALTLYLNGQAIATAMLASNNRTNEKLDTFSGRAPLNGNNNQTADFSNVQLYQGVLSPEQIAALSVPEPATATLGLAGLAFSGAPPQKAAGGIAFRTLFSQRISCYRDIRFFVAEPGTASIPSS